MDGIAGFRYEGVTYLYRKNIQGDITHIYDIRADGSLIQVAHYAYDAFGNVKELQENSAISKLNPFRYRGYYYDSETKLYYLISRYYDPETGRFISADGIEYLDPETLGGLNLYAYCGNNPVMNVDPTGHFILSLFIAAVIAGAVAGTVLGGTYGAVTAAANGQNIGWGILIGAVSGLFLGAIAGAAGYFMGPLLAGASTIASLSSGASFAVGLSIALGGGFVVGFATDLATQAVNDQKVDLGSAALSGLQASLFTVISAMFGSSATGFIENLCVNFGSGILTSALSLLVDVVKNYFFNKGSSSIKLKVANGI